LIINPGETLLYPLFHPLDFFGVGVSDKIIRIDAPAEDAPGHEMAPVGWRVKQEGTLDAAVAFIATLEPKRPTPTVSGDAVRGKTLYAACAGCHGARGEGNPALQAPALAARSDWYLVTQLANYRKGLRGADERDVHGAQMRAVIAALPDDKAVTDVVSYLNSL